MKTKETDNNIQQRLIRFVTLTNWILLVLSCVAGFVFFPSDFARGILFGGLIVTINFHMLARTLKNALTPPYIASHNFILARYYIRFVISGVIIFFLIANHYVNPIGLFIGLSVVVASIMLATLMEIKNLFLKEAI